MSILFSALELKNHWLNNRIVVAPMCQYSAVDGFATNYHLVHLGQYALGKAGAIIQEATAVVPEGRISHGDLGLWKEEHIEALKPITAFMKEHGSVPGIQLTHAGRKASYNKPWIERVQIAADQPEGWQTVGPSALPFHPSKDMIPHALTVDEIHEVVEAFGQAAARAVLAGYEIIEIHGAHGYLVHQFLSPLVNVREDLYGGSFENRTRLLMEILEAIKKVVTTQSIWVRLSATDWAEGGWNIEETVQLAQLLKDNGVEVVDVSTGGAVYHQEIDLRPNYQVPFAAAVKAETSVLTGAVGLIKTGPQAEEILQNEQADLIFVAREFLRNPHFVYQAAKDLGEDIAWADQYERGKE